jgi:secondary thiamine-phosphate synthase enzyme
MVKEHLHFQLVLADPMLRIVSEEIHFDTEGEGDMIDITDDLSELLQTSGLHDGLLTVFVPGSTAAVTTIEYEPGLRQDLPKALDRIAPGDIPYEHDNTWHDGNGRSHVRAALVGPGLTVPFRDGRMTLGTWQQVILVEMDIHRRSRRLIVQIMGE